MRWRRFHNGVRPSVNIESGHGDNHAEDADNKTKPENPLLPDVKHFQFCEPLGNVCNEVSFALSRSRSRSTSPFVAVRACSWFQIIKGKTTAVQLQINALSRWLLPANLAKVE